MTDYPGWQGILDEGEQILWQGQPDGRLRMEPADLKKMLPGLFMAGFALFWMWQAAQANLFLALFGLLFLGIGLRRSLLPVVLPAWGRARSWYTLTDRRAIVATDMPFQRRRLTSYPIHRDTPIELVATDPASILIGAPGPGQTERPGFHFIPDAAHVLALIGKLQQGQIAREESRP